MRHIPPIPSHFMHCHCHIGDPVDGESGVAIRGADDDRDLAVTVSSGCVVHDHVVRKMAMGAQFSISIIKHVDGSETATLTPVLAEETGE
jgi:hypothetical protein